MKINQDKYMLHKVSNSRKIRLQQFNHKPSLGGGKHELQFEKKPSFNADELYPAHAAEFEEIIV
jgi:hypothetical protein